MRNKSWLAVVFVLLAGLASAAVPKQVVLDVQNMTCALCSITIGKALDKVPGVTAKKIDAEAATVTVTFDPDRTSAADVIRAVSEAGFPAKARADGG